MQTAARSMAWEAIELPGLHKDGHEVPLEISFGEFIRNGRRYFTGIARDITERRRAEDALRRSREERLAELERVRRRIATDLHDDIGSSLTRISLLGEVAQRQVQKDQAPLLEPLGTISDLSRELVDTMSDIVWAINPNKDHLSDLSQRMRHFVERRLHGPPDRFRFRTPDAGRDIERGRERASRGIPVVQGGGEQHRAAFRLHRGRSRTARRAGRPVARVSDNGRGFDVIREAQGHGLVSMRDRTRGLGGALDVLSKPGEGTAPWRSRIPIYSRAHSPHEYAVTKPPART